MSATIIPSDDQPLKQVSDGLNLNVMQGDPESVHTKYGLQLAMHPEEEQDSFEEQLRQILLEK